jgi:hypothetical protein
MAAVPSTEAENQYCRAETRSLALKSALSICSRILLYTSSADTQSDTPIFSSNQGTTEVGDSFDRHYAGVGNSNKIATLLALLFPVPSLNIARIHNIGVFSMVKPGNTVDSVPGQVTSDLSCEAHESGVYQVIPVWLKFDRWNNVFCWLSFACADR